MIYISGPITKDENYKAKFEAAEKFLTSIAAYGGVVNPCKLAHDNSLTWKDYMVVDIYSLLECDAIYMLKGWRKSKGAKLERQIAKGLGLRIIYQP